MQEQYFKRDGSNLVVLHCSLSGGEAVRILSPLSPLHHHIYSGPIVHYLFPTTSSLQVLVLLSSCLCHLYVYSVAQTHTKNISKTLQSHHASMQRLNSICGAKSPSQTNQRDTMMVYNGAGAGIDTCLLYTGRPSGPSSSTTNLQTTQTLTVVTPRQQISLLTPPPVSLTLTPTRPHPDLESEVMLGGSVSVQTSSQRTCYLLLTPLALLSAWAPDMTHRIISFSQHRGERPGDSWAVQLSLHIPLLVLGCLNPWLYHKLSLSRCHGQFVVSKFILLQNATNENKAGQASSCEKGLLN